MKKILLITLYLLSFSLAAQEQAWIFLTEKPNAEIRVETPGDFLTTKAILRKQKHGVNIDSRDLPIEESYINTIKAQSGITFLATSKWFNGIFIEGDQSNIEGLLALDFVSSIFYMNRSLNTTASAKNLRTTDYLDHNKIETTDSFIYGETETQVTQLNLNTLHDANFTADGITIAVMDNGFNNVDIIDAFDRARDHNLLLGGYDFEDKTSDIFAFTGGSHGTNVLSTMLGFIENEFVGTAIDAQYYLFRTEVEASETPREEAYWIAAAERADSLGVDIIHTSLGYSTFDDSKYNYSPSDMDGQTTFISRAATIALEKGILPVNSAGNSGNNTWGIITAPADSPGILSVGAIDSNGVIAGFSSVGPTADGRIKPDVVALGVNTSIIRESGAIGTSSGTSFSGPVVAGAIASLWQSIPDRSPQEIMDLVRSSGHLATNPNTDLGYGIPDFGSILETLNLTETPNIIEDPVENLTLLHNPPMENELTFIFPENYRNQQFSIYDTSGEKVFSGTMNKDTSVFIGGLSNGLYFFIDENNEAVKFVKL